MGYGQYGLVGKGHTIKYSSYCIVLYCIISTWCARRHKAQDSGEFQNENMAAFFRVPNMYTSAWLMKSPTVMPIVTAIIALPISIPLPDAVIAPPPACERPDFEYQKKGSAEGPQFFLRGRNTYRDQEEHARDHDRERSATEHTRVNIPKQADRESANRRDDI